MTARRARYNRGSLNSAISAAQRIKSREDLYIYPTARGYTIRHCKPQGGLQHLIVHPDGQTTYVKEARREE